ncbi:MAG: BTAD domain-containing putative transcriptional regulator, partial [Gemmatimonadota bacterium]
MLELHAFGPVDLRAEEGGLGAVVTQPKRVALLLYLVLARPQRLQRRDTLLALFWPELDEARARSALSQSLSFLRRGLPESLLRVRGGEEVGVDPGGIRCDVIEFERAVEERRWADAVELYRGELLAGFHVPDSAGFEAWLDVERERLRELAAGAAWSLARQRIEGGELVLAERAGQRALRLVPTDESAARDFIRALAAAGDRAAALRFYDKFAGVLAEELDVEPAPETTAVMEAIRAGTIGPAPATPGAEETAAAAPGEDRYPGDGEVVPVAAQEGPVSGEGRPVIFSRIRPYRWPTLVAAGVVLALAGVVLSLVPARQPSTVA